MKAIYSIMIVVGLLLYCNMANSQVLQSVERENFKLKNIDTLTVDTLNELAWIYSNKNIDSAFYYATEAQEIAIKLNYLKGQADSYARLGVIYIYSNNYKQALNNIKKALNFRSKLGDKAGETSMLMTLGNVHYLMGKYDSSNEIYFQCVEQYQNLNNSDSSALGTVYHNIGNNYLELGNLDIATKYYLKALEIHKDSEERFGEADAYISLGIIKEKLKYYDNALEYYQESSKIYKELGNKRNFGESLTNIGNIYNLKQEVDMALSYYRKGLDIKTELKDSLGIGFLNQNIGIVYAAKQDFSKAQKYYNISLDVYQKIGDKKGMAQVYNYMGDLSKEKKDYNTTLEYYRKALNIATAAKLKMEVLENHEDLATVYYSTGDYKNAYDYDQFADTLKYNLGKGELISMELLTLQKNKMILLEKNNEILHQKNELQQLELDRIRLYNNVYFFAFVVFILIVLTVFWGIRERQKKQMMEQKMKLNNQRIDRSLEKRELEIRNKMLDWQEQERKRIAQNLHDEIGGLLATTKYYFNNHTKEVYKTQAPYVKVNELLDDVGKRIRAISHEMSSGILRKFGLVEELKNLCDTINQIGDIEAELTVFGMEVRLPQTIENQLYLVFKEIVANTLKYANATDLSIQLNRFDKNNLEVIVQDDGIGFDKNTTKKGMGLKNIEARIGNLNGTFDIYTEPGKGTTFNIKIPIPPN